MSVCRMLRDVLPELCAAVSLQQACRVNHLPGDLSIVLLVISFEMSQHDVHTNTTSQHIMSNMLHGGLSV